MAKTTGQTENELTRQQHTQSRRDSNTHRVDKTATHTVELRDAAATGAGRTTVLGRKERPLDVVEAVRAGARVLLSVVHPNAVRSQQIRGVPHRRLGKPVVGGQQPEG
jgi:hypothetical protein